MSMSTPVNNLPLRTQPPNEDSSDISDPMVQDVLNEFQSELMMSHKPQAEMPQLPAQASPQALPQASSQALPQASPQILHQQAFQQQQQQALQQQALQQQQVYKSQRTKQEFPYSLIDTQLMQKTLVIVIIIILVYHTSILCMMYEKLPLYAFDFCDKFDMYIKLIMIFVIIYALFIFAYI